MQSEGAHKACTAFQGIQGLKAVSQRIKAEFAQPLFTLALPDGPSQGALTADPGQVDRIMRDAWAPIYEGNCANLERTVDAFFVEYTNHIYRSEPHQVETIRWQDLRSAATHATDAAGGLDGWTKLFLYWMSDVGF